MTNFPNGFTETPTMLFPADVVDVMPEAAQAIEELDRFGFNVYAGTMRSDVPALAEISAQETVREYCANDLAKRWATEDMTGQQLGKDGGRGTLLLKNMRSHLLAAHGWTGRAREHERAMTGGVNTFAIRFNEMFQGMGLARRFSLVIVGGSMALWGADRIGLETWGSNSAAVRTYLGAGALLTNTEGSQRPTRRSGPGVFMFKGEDGVERPHVHDTRLYMKFPQTFPETS